MNHKLLLLEDEFNVGSTLKARLEYEGYEVYWAQTILQCKNKLQPFSLALLDVNLPDGNGFEFGEHLRKHYPSTAIVFLTAAGTPEDRVHGLEIGAEDYIVKPFHFKELLLRIQNALKRAQFINGLTAHNEVMIGKAKVFFDRYELESDNQKIHLSHKECALLKLLYEKRGTVVSRDEVLNLIWGEDEYPTLRTIDNFILRLRKLIEPNADIPSTIKSVRGVGYLMEKVSNVPEKK